MTDTIGFTPTESADLAFHQIQGVAHTYFNQWKKDRGVDIGPI